MTVLETEIRREITKSLEWLGCPSELLAQVRGASKKEICFVAAQLNADRELLATIGSWGDTLTDEEVLADLREWNAWAAVAKMSRG